MSSTITQYEVVFLRKGEDTERRLDFGALARAQEHAAFLLRTGAVYADVWRRQVSPWEMLDPGGRHHNEIREEAGCGH